MNPFIGSGAGGQVIDDPERRSFRSRSARLHRRRLYRSDPDRRPTYSADVASPRARRSGAADGSRRSKTIICTPSTSRPTAQSWPTATITSDLDPYLSRRIRPAAAAHDLRLEGKRHQDDSVRDRKAKVIAEAMGGKSVEVKMKQFGEHYDTRLYQTTHKCRRRDHG